MSRFQKNLFQDRSFLLRVQYLKDGWTLFTQSPLTGHGLGATEGLLTSVQPFFYQSLDVYKRQLYTQSSNSRFGKDQVQLVMSDGSVKTVDTDDDYTSLEGTIVYYRADDKGEYALRQAANVQDVYKRQLPG